MSLLRVLILAVVQGVAELLPISSSAHVVVAEKLMGLDPSSPEMTLLLVMLHTGTMVAVIWYFWKRWRQAFFQNAAAFKSSALLLVVATAITGIIGEILIKIIERTWFHSAPDAEVEQLFSHLELIAPALALAGILIIVAGLFEERTALSRPGNPSGLDMKQAVLIGGVQGLCLPFRGFSRSGATISTGMLAGVPKVRAEEFSFALAVILTPPVVAREALRLIKAGHIANGSSLASATMPSILGAVCAFLAGLVALRWLSRWLESGRWYLFGVYCLIAAGAVMYLHHVGY
ncbi:MAG TPA: undecaprenyl-diphosphate phosphatase [Vicinamibacterales bacterium]|jgi:undecaprenyl-diphosphatase|nr:undecaprenyl-diphosphate phosphatase [Vicinamibacterales bacterium]